ncbi:hypothetical protein JXA85_00975 [Candidatus Woesearchaeota archaeon]|nr:hypothetical protein [Candidatus Woesearchaeota archaeon]
MIIMKSKTMMGVFILLFALLMLDVSLAVPGGPNVTYIANYTSSTTGSRLVDNANHTGGVIAVMNLNLTQQDVHWKAYVGNVTGRLALQDSDNYAIYDWSFATITGEVYATRASSVTWSGVRCANSSDIDIEMTEMNHTATYTPLDNISTTFLSDRNNHDSFVAGPLTVSANECNYSMQTYVNGTNQTSSEYFEEVLLYDPAVNKTIYTTIIEGDQWAYHTGWTFDYQLLVAEKGEPTFSGVTPYYFYVELG